MGTQFVIFTTSSSSHSQHQYGGGDVSEATFISFGTKLKIIGIFADSFGKKIAELFYNTHVGIQGDVGKMKTIIKLN